MSDTGVHSKVKEPERTGQIQFDKVMGVRGSMLWVSRLWLPRSVHKIVIIWSKTSWKPRLHFGVWRIASSFLWRTCTVFALCQRCQISRILKSTANNTYYLFFSIEQIKNQIWSHISITLLVDEIAETTRHEVITPNRKYLLDGTCLVVQWLRLCLPKQGVWVQSLVRELRSHRPHGQKTKI